jgi:TetR/AcrR family transcriptional regulator, regulator of cefoperazone and chloramphenicol sensitivity
MNTNEQTRQLEAVPLRTGTPRAEKTRQHIIDAAGPLFADKGYKATTVAEICRVAGVNQAAISFHFGGKEQLYLALVRYSYEYGLAQVPIPEWPAGTPAAVKLRDFILTFLRRAVADREPGWPCQLIMRETMQPSKACEEFVRGFVRPNFTVLRGILQELLPADFSEEGRRLVGQSIIGQALFYRAARGVLELMFPGEQPLRFDEERLQVLAEHITRFTLAALGVLPPLGTKGDNPLGEAETAPFGPQAEGAKP